jgi:hypothetical protein
MSKERPRARVNAGPKCEEKSDAGSPRLRSSPPGRRPLMASPRRLISIASREGSSLYQKQHTEVEIALDRRRLRPVPFLCGPTITGKEICLRALTPTEYEQMMTVHLA